MESHPFEHDLIAHWQGHRFLGPPQDPIEQTDTGYN